MEIADCRANMKANFLKFLNKISNQQPDYYITYYQKLSVFQIPLRQ